MSSGQALRDRLRGRLGGAHAPLPRLYRRLRSRRIWLRRHPLGRLTARYLAESGLTVAAGPFTGMRYPPRAVARVGFLTAKLVGAYEREIYPDLTEAEIFVDVGAGDGFYCVGYARRFPEARVIGYETDRGQRRIAAELAALNGAEIELRGTCSPADLDALPAEHRVLLLTDVEGYERELLHPEAVPGLARMKMIVEAHLDVDPRMIEILGERFEATHEVEARVQQPREPAAFASLRGWDEADAAAALAEGRDDGTWLILTPIES